MKGQVSLCGIFIIFFANSFQVQADFQPAMSSIYGDYFIPGVNQEPALGTIGLLDTTFGVNGSLSLAGQMISGYAKAIRALSDGTFLIALSKSSSNSILVKYTALGTVDRSNFGASGIVDLGISTAKAQAMMIDAQGRSLIAGGNDTVSGSDGWLKRVSADGNTVTSFSTRTAWQFIGALAEQTSGKIIAVGSNNSYAQLARYNLSGSLDTSFGASGYVVLNGMGLLPNVPSGLYSVVVDASNLIYITYVDNNNTAWIARFTTDGALDTSFHTISAKLAIFAFNGASPNTMRIAMNANNNLIVAAQVGNNIVVTGATNTADPIPGFSAYSLSARGVTYNVQSLLTMADNSIVLIGSNETAKKSRVTKLTGSGLLDTRFNGSLGYNEFSINSPSTSSYLTGATVSPDGRLYTIGTQSNGGVITSYVSRLYNNMYVTQVAQFPISQEQGNRDLTFGCAESYDVGVVSPFNGFYGSILTQKAKAVIELMSEEILIGMDGKTNTSANSNMMLARLTSAGILDTTFNHGAATKLLPSHHTNEYLYTILEDLLGNLYVSGYSTDGAILRQYTSSGDESWVADNNSAGYQGLEILFQGINRIFLSTQVTPTTGQIVAYNFTDGTIDTDFHVAGSVPGVILSTDFNLNLGPVYGIALDPAGNIFVAYKNSVTGYVDVAAIEKDGLSLLTDFASMHVTPGIYENVFGLFGLPTIVPSNVRLAFDNNYNIVVGMVNNLGTGVQMIGLESSTGDINFGFNSGSILNFTILESTSLSFSRITAISDGTFILTMSDIATDDTMLVARVSAQGTLDATFNCQGDQPGILPIKIESNVRNYTRIATDLMVQSSTGNLILTGYEQQSSRDATPMAMRIFGAYGTTEVNNRQSVNESGTIDLSFATAGVFDFYALLSLTSSSTTNAVYSYPTGDIYEGKLLVGIDTGTTTLVARVHASDMSLDTTFAVNGVYTASPHLRGIGQITADAQGHILLAGSYAGQGWIQRLTSSGLFDLACNVPTTMVAIHQMYQQKSGRYIAAGVDGGGHGLIVAFQDELVTPATTLAVDTSFNPLGSAGSGSTKGIYQINAAIGGLFSLAIDSDDTLIVVYKNVISRLEIAKIKADGSGAVASFNSGNSVATAIISDSSSACRVVIDSAENIIVAASYNAGGADQLQVARYDAHGGTTTQFTGSGVMSGMQIITNVGTSGVTLTSMIETTTAHIVLVGSNQSGGNGKLFAVNLNSDGALDSLWNSSPIGTDTIGVLTAAVDGVTQIAGSAISIRGNVYVAASTTTHPLLVKITGDHTMIALGQQPFEVAPGIIDTTLDTLTPGSNSFNLDAAVSMIGCAKKIYIDQADGWMLLASSDGMHSYITKLNADLTLAGTGSSPTFGLNGVITIGSANISDVYVAHGTNDDGTIYVTGDTGGSHPQMWSCIISGDGTNIIPLRKPTLVAGVTLTNGYAIRQSTNSRVLIAGTTTTSGVITAFDAHVSSIDTTFGQNGFGYYYTNVSSPILDMVVDSLNRIYIAFVDAGVIKLQRLVESGGMLDTRFGSSGTIVISPVYGVTASTQIRLSLDQLNQQLVVAFQDGATFNNMINVHRYSTDSNSDGAVNGAISMGITISSDIVTLSDLLIDAVQNIYVAGYSADNLGLVARIQSVNATTLALDVTYGSAGIAAVNTGAMHRVYAAALDPDRRVYLVGDDGSTTAYMARVFGNLYSSQDSQAIAKAIPGTLDYSFGIDQDGAFELDSLSGQIGSAIPQAVQLKSDGSMVIAMQTNVLPDVSDEVLVVAIENDLELDDAGIIDIPTFAPGVRGLTFDALDQIIVAGNNESSSWVARFDGSTGLPVGTFPTILTMTSVVGLLVQSNGRMILGGDQDLDHGVLVALAPISFVDGNLTSTPIFDQSYACDARFTHAQISSINSFAIDGKDRVVLGFVASGAVKLARVRPNGSDLDTTFGSNGLVTTTISNSTGSKPAKVAVDCNNNFIAACTTTTGLSVRRYDEAGITENVGFDITNGALGLSAPIISQILTTITNQIIVLGYDNVVDGNMFAMRLNAAGLLDTTFNPQGSVPGILTFVIHSGDTIHRLQAAAIASDGRIVITAYEDQP